MAELAERADGALTAPLRLGAPLPFAASRARQGDGESYIQRLHETFLVACEAAGGVVECDLAIGPARVRLRFAGDALVRPMLPALAHRLTSEPAAPSLTLCVWDSGSTGVEIPPFPWLPRDVRQRGEVAGYNDARLRTVYHGAVLDSTLGFNGLSMFDAEARSGIFWVESLEGLPWFEVAAPLRLLLHWGLMDQSGHLLHAGAVVNKDGGVLLGGKGGSGKSTSTLACIDAGFNVVSDDCVLVTGGDRPLAHGIFCTVKVRSDGIHFHPRIRDMVGELNRAGEEKYVLNLYRHMPERLALSAPIDAVLLPRLSDSGRVAVRPTSPTQALLDLAPSTIYQIPSSRGESLRTMSEIVKRVRTYVLELGGPPDHVPAAIAELLTSLRTA